jgi:hypothetical protein
VDIHDERRSEARATLHRTWTVSVDSEVFGTRCAQVLDTSPSGIKLCLKAVSGLEPGVRLAIHHPGTNCSYLATVAWCQQQQQSTIVGAQISVKEHATLGLNKKKQGPKPCLISHGA